MTLRATFVYDDTSLIRANDRLHAWAAVWRAWGWEYWPHGGSGLYRPLHVSALAVLWNAGGGRPLPFHLYALALHALAAWMLWRLLARAVSLPAAFAAALWFAVHPLHVEVVASVSNSSDLLVMLFTLLLVDVLRREGEIGWARAAVAATLATAALLSKESGILALPIALITGWGWSAERGPPLSAYLAARRRVLLAAAGALGVGVVARAVVLSGSVAAVVRVAPGLADASAPERAAIMLSLWPRLAAMLGAPYALAPYYGASTLPAPRAMWAAAGGVLLIVLSLAAYLAARRGERRPAVALAWVVLGYLPASNILLPTGILIADRALFLASVGAALGLAVLIDRARGRVREIARGVLVAAALVMAGESLLYAAAWTTHRTLWERLVAAAPDEPLGYALLGHDRRLHGDSARALELLARAVALDPRHASVRIEYATLLHASGRDADAAIVLAPVMADPAFRRDSTLAALWGDVQRRAASGAP